MILQQFPFSPVMKKILEQYYNNVGGTVPDDDYNHGFSTLLQDSTKGMMYDLVRNSSLLFDKIDINDIIDFPVDITDFENKSGQLELVDESVNDSFSKYDSPLKVVPNDVMGTSPYNTTASAIQKFITFVRVVGMSELSLDDVYLSESDGELSITMSETHPIFTGALRIKTW